MLAVVSFFSQRVWRNKTAQQSVQPTGGIRPDLQAFFWLRAFFCSQAESTPAHQRLTQTVRLQA
jgi:hypothetical protein